MDEARGSDGSWFDAAFAPSSVAIVGASDNPEKIGGRPIKYMLAHGYTGALYPINPSRDTIQGLPSYSSLTALPATPDMAIICVPGQAAVDAVEECAARGVRLVVVISSGFGEVGAAGKEAQDRMQAAARRAGMRLVGPNTQGLANFANGAIASFATLIGEIPPVTGPVAIVSQSGAMSMVPYAFLLEKGIGVKHSHATGNEADLSVADFALAVVRDPDVKLLLLYVESIKDPATLAKAAKEALRRGVRIIALKAGVSEQGQAAASSHTGAIATEDHVIDAFFRQHGILRVADMRSMMLAARLYLQGWAPQGTHVAAISNSGASCVMAADAAVRHGLAMERFTDSVQNELKTVLPSFASTLNPIDLTAALLSNSGLLGQVLPIVADHHAADGFLITLPMSGKGYDVPRFARDARDFVAKTGAPTVVASPLAATRAMFESEGVVTFEHDEDAMAALGQFLRHERLCGEARHLTELEPQLGRLQWKATAGRFLSEADSLDALARAGVRVAEHAVCHSEQEAADAAFRLGGSLAIKACSADIPHKSEFGLVLLGVGPADAAAAYREIVRRAKSQTLPIDGIIVAKMVKARREFIVGGRWDPAFGAIVMVGDGGKYVEAMPDVVTLVHPFNLGYALRQMQRLRVAALFDGVRGESPLPVADIAGVAVTVAGILHAAGGAIASIDINPLMADEDGRVVAADALIELRGESTEA